MTLARDADYIRIGNGQLSDDEWKELRSKCDFDPKMRGRALTIIELAIQLYCSPGDVAVLRSIATMALNLGKALTECDNNPLLMGIIVHLSRFYDSDPPDVNGDERRLLRLRNEAEDLAHKLGSALRDLELHRPPRGRDNSRLLALVAALNIVVSRCTGRSHLSRSQNWYRDKENRGKFRDIDFVQAVVKIARSRCGESPDYSGVDRAMKAVISAHKRQASKIVLNTDGKS